MVPVLGFRARPTPSAPRARDGLDGDPTELGWVYVITPTYKRLAQKADLIRMANTLRQVPRLKWIVVEDAKAKSGRW